MTTDHDAVVEAIHQRLRGTTLPGEGTGPVSPLNTLAHKLARTLAPLASPDEQATLAEDALSELVGLGRLQALLDEPDVREVMVNAGSQVWVERHGRLERVTSLAPGRLDALLERILAPLDRRLDRATPTVDARLPDGSRVCAVVPPVAVDGPCLCIRRFSVDPLPLGAFGGPTMVEALTAAVRQRRNTLVVGATSSGKTTLLNALAGVIPTGERVITLEDVAELRLAAAHVLRLETRPATSDGVGEVDLRALLRTALRLRPDRLVVGEVRGAEALDMVQALSTGHDGSLATCHANGPEDALRRVEAMVLQGAPAWPLAAVRQQVHASIDLVVHVARAEGGARRVVEIAEVVPADELVADAQRRTRTLLPGPAT
jgi:pilus assembly protein CpaF